MVKQILDEADKWTISLIVFVAVSFMIIGFLRSTEIGTGVDVSEEHDGGFNTLENPNLGPVLFINTPDAGVVYDATTSEQ